MKLFIFLLTLGGIGMFIWQNQEPVVLHFFGNSDTTALVTLKLSLGIVVIMFTTAGILTSLVIQFLNRSPTPIKRPYTPVKPEAYSPRPKPPTTPPYPPQTQPQEPLEQVSSPPPEPTDSQPTTKLQSDWETPPIQDTNREEEDWDIEELPSKATSKREEFEEFDRIREEQLRNFETQQEPKTSSRSGSVYSYTYREGKDQEKKEPKDTQTKADKSEKVYDANYRVITPPYRQISQASDDEDDEDWI